MSNSDIENVEMLLAMAYDNMDKTEAAAKKKDDVAFDHYWNTWYDIILELEKYKDVLKDEEYSVIENQKMLAEELKADFNQKWSEDKEEEIQAPPRSKLVIHDSDEVDLDDYINGLNLDIDF